MTSYLFRSSWSVGKTVDVTLRIEVEISGTLPNGNRWRHKVGEGHDFSTAVISSGVRSTDGITIEGEVVTVDSGMFPARTDFADVFIVVVPGSSGTFHQFKHPVVSIHSLETDLCICELFLDHDFEQEDTVHLMRFERNGIRWAARLVNMGVN